jgi:hypothetical protein
MTNEVRLEARQILSSVAAMVRDHRLVRGMYVQEGDKLPTLRPHPSATATKPALSGRCT